MVRRPLKVIAANPMRQVMVDGNAAALRWSAALCTGTTILATRAFELWLHFKLKPWEHYVPVE